MPTKVNEAKLREWKEKLPKRLHIFLDNFFGTCQRYDPMVNWLNYQFDLTLYGKTTREYRQYREELEEAFYDITGWDPGVPEEGKFSNPLGPMARNPTVKENYYQVAFVAENASERLDDLYSLAKTIDRRFPPSVLTGMIIGLWSASDHLGLYLTFDASQFDEKQYIPLFEDWLTRYDLKVIEVMQQSPEKREKIITEFATGPDVRFIGDVDIDVAFSAFRGRLHRFDRSNQETRREPSSRSGDRK